MAILMEDEKKPINWIGIISGLVIVAGVFFGGYYLFFKSPDSIEVVIPGKLQDLNNLSQITFDPKTVLDSTSGERAAKIFKILTDHTTPFYVPAPGKDNPFRSL